MGSGVDEVAVGEDMEAWIQSWDRQWGSTVDEVALGQMRQPGFNPGVVHVRSVVYKVPMGQVFLSKDRGFSLPNTNITVMLIRSQEDMLI
jgi:hypothetical protein